MRLRPRTIRTQLLALLLVPMVSLAALWAYGSYTTLDGALALTRVNATDDYYGVPAEEFLEALQRERLAAVEFDAGQGREGGAALARAEAATDAAAAVLRQHLRERADGSRLNTDQNGKVSAVLVALDSLPGTRASVKADTVNWYDILNGYSVLIEAEFAFQSSLTDQQTGQVARKGVAVVELARARELLSQEDALVLGGYVGHSMTDPEYNLLIGDIDSRQTIDSVYESELPGPDAAKLSAFENGDVGSSLMSEDSSAKAASAQTVQEAIPPVAWRATVEVALGRLAAIDQDADRQVDSAAHRSGMAVLDRAAVVLLIGLLAMIASLIISLRIGRRIALRLTALRDAAEDMSGRRLPELMRRLRDGTIDDAEAEAAAWSLVLSGPGGGPGSGGGSGADAGSDAGSGGGSGGGEVGGGTGSGSASGGSPGAPDVVEEFGDDEIGQVGRAFGVAQRAAVQAAVEQARLRRGVAAVFTTLARRSQVILHRQLNLLDTMERRAQDPGELADLFRLDHMSNRMRRQAEGLLILSGLTPGRAWRRPVRVGEVVRAAVGEVEGYERIAVRRMPGVALAGAVVADVLHLLAELMENATAFSPPDTEVVVSGAEVAAGFAVEIEDRGLGMNAARLAEANQAIRDAAARAQTADGGTLVIDLPETDRLGLFTVGRLSVRHGVRVTLRRTAHGGTVAVVLIPTALFAAPEDGEQRASTSQMSAAAVPEDRGPRRAKSRARGGAVSSGGTASSGGSSDGGCGGGAGDGAASGGAGDGGAGGGPGGGVPSDGASGGGAAGGASGVGASGGASGGGASAAGASGGRGPVRAPRPSETADLATAAGLPRRVPSRARASRPREEPVAHDRSEGEGQDHFDRERSPEEARSVMTAFARGLARGRDDSADERIPGAGAAVRDGAPGVPVDEAEVGGTTSENAIEKAIAGERTTEEDGGPTS